MGSLAFYDQSKIYIEVGVIPAIIENLSVIIGMEETGAGMGLLPVDEETLSMACRALGNMSRNEESATEIIQNKGLPLLMTLMSSNNRKLERWVSASFLSCFEN